ncbi:MAG: class I SAM-dependent methyltransferase [Thermodesulfobacteriota bacterium]
MTILSDSACPLCQGSDCPGLLRLDCGNLDGSTLYQELRLHACSRCGHVFNALTARELAGLAAYYHQEYAASNLGAAATGGDRPGSADPLTRQRYQQLAAALMPHVRPDDRLLDVGCALGGFLLHLAGQGFRHLAGVEMTQAYVERAREVCPFPVAAGSAEALPFEDHSLDAVVLEQVLEHLAAPGQALAEARRVLRPGGILCLGVPDAAAYQEQPFFDFYWLLLREHIQHFDATAIAWLGARHGFTLLAAAHTTHAVMSPTMVMPNLYAVLRATGPADPAAAGWPDPGRLRQKMTAYLHEQQARRQRHTAMLAELARAGTPVYAWGVGRELLYLWAAGLAACRIQGLIDTSPHKQRHCTLGGRPIGGSEVLGQAAAEATLLITAVAHTGPIAQAARALGFPGSILSLA